MSSTREFSFLDAAPTPLLRLSVLDDNGRFILRVMEGQRLREVATSSSSPLLTAHIARAYPGQPSTWGSVQG